MIKNWFLMKQKEIKMKLTFLTMLEKVLKDKDDIICTINKLYISLKDVPSEELQNMFVSAIVEAIHKENKYDNN